LDRWAAENKIGQPRLVSHTPVTAYAIGSANGTMVLDIGSREATWNNTEIQLGFTPEFIDDQVLSTASICRKTSDRCCSGRH